MEALRRGARGEAVTQIKSFEDLGARKQIRRADILATLENYANIGDPIDSSVVLDMLDRFDLTRVDLQKSVLRSYLIGTKNQVIKIGDILANSFDKQRAWDQIEEWNKVAIHVFNIDISDI